MSKMFNTLLGEGDQDPSYALVELSKQVLFDLYFVEGGQVPYKLVMTSVGKTKIKDMPEWRVEVVYKGENNEFETYLEQNGTHVVLNEETMGILQSILYVATRVGEGDLMMINDLRRISGNQRLTVAQLDDVMADMVKDFLAHGRKEVTPELLDLNLRAGHITSFTLVEAFQKMLETELALSY